MATAHLIGNPRSGRGGLAGLWSDLEATLGSSGLEVIARKTERPGHASALASQARAEGAGLVVAAGGDGTVNEVVNGLLAEGPRAKGPREPMPALGIIPLGSGCDYAKTFDIPQDPMEAASHLVGRAVERRVDAGKITFESKSGADERYFANIAEVGIGADTVRRAAGLPRRLGGAVYGLAFMATLPLYRRPNAAISFWDGSAPYEGPLINLVVAIGRVFGGGMRVAPEADPTDGLFDVQIQHGSKLDYVRSLPKVYRGTHLPHPRVRQVQASALEVVCQPSAVVEADGEVLGSVPATFTCLKGALRLRV